MPEVPVQLNVVRRLFDNGLQIAEIQFYPEATALHDADDTQYTVTDLAPARVRELVKLVETAARDLPPLALSRRRISGTASVKEISIRIQSPDKDIRWTEPVELRFHVVIWQMADQWLAWLPVLDIEVFANARGSDSEKLTDSGLPAVLESRLRAHIRFALQRNKWATKLQPLVWLDRCRHLSLQRTAESIRLPTPRQIESGEGKRESRPVLKEVADRLRPEKMTPAFEVQHNVQLLTEALLGDNKRSVILIGPSGVGKTAVVQEMIRSWDNSDVAMEFWVTSGSRLVAGMSGFGMWQERCEKMCRELSRRNAALYVGNLPELVEAGKSGSSSQGIGDFLRNRVDRGELTLITECTPQQFTVLERDAPGIAHSFLQIRIEEPDLATGRAILLNTSLWSAQQREKQRKKRLKKLRKQKKSKPTSASIADETVPVNQEPLSLDAIEKIDRLHRRYSAYSAYPGRAIRFVRNLVADKPAEVTLSADDVTRAFASETGLPYVLLDESTALQTDTVRNWFCERVIGQKQAIDLLVDLIAAVKAGLTRPDRPIASLLFIGPTGVGKTEMAKAIAEYFFQDRSRMIRIDMSEYSDPSSIDRLVGGPLQSEGILTSRVRDQPFGVVLLDEFEKADPRFFDLLLQVLGEGRLTDSSGNLADFRNSIVIMTSNLGVESSSRGQVGFGLQSADESDEQFNNLQNHFVREVQQFLRPEMFNRIDRIVPFRALDRDTLRKITQRELNLVQQRDGIEYRGVALEIEADVIDELVEVGHDIRYGARPLKRAVEQHLLQPLAQLTIDYDPQLALAAQISVSEKRNQTLGVHVRGLQNERVKAGGAGINADSSASEAAARVSQIRRKVVQLEHSSTSIEARNELFRIRESQQRIMQAYDRALKAGHTKTEYPRPGNDVVQRLATLEEYTTKLTALREEIVLLEEDVLQSLYSGESFESELVADALQSAHDKWKTLLITAYALSWGEVRTDQLSMAIYFEPGSVDFARDLLDAYQFVFEQLSFRADYFVIFHSQSREGTRLNEFILSEVETRPEVIKSYNEQARREWKSLLENSTHLIAKKTDNFSEARNKISDETVMGIGMWVRGPMAALLLEPERGRHERIGKSTAECLVQTSDSPFKEIVPPVDIDRKGTIRQASLRRSWDRRTSQMNEPGEDPLSWSRTHVPQTMLTAIQARMMREAERCLD